MDFNFQIFHQNLSSLFIYFLFVDSVKVLLMNNSTKKVLHMFTSSAEDYSWDKLEAEDQRLQKTCLLA